MNNSIQLFQGALVGFTDEPPLELTPAEQDQALLDIEQAIRKTHFNEIQNIRKRGEGFYNAKRSAPGRFLEWQQDMRILYAETGGERGFTYSEKTIENYMNLHRLYLVNDGTYERYRDFPAWIVYQVASAYLNGRDPETVPAIRAIREQNVLQIPESAGGTAAQTGCVVPDSYPALQIMCDEGELSPIMADRLIMECEQLSDVVVHAVQLWGVRGAAELQTLCDIEASMMRAQSANEPYNNLFVEAASTNGMVSTEDGDQVLMRDMSSRELWAAYRRSRYQGTDGGSGSGGAKSIKLFKGFIKRDSAMEIARALNSNSLLEQLGGDDTDRLYELKLDKPL